MNNTIIEMKNVFLHVPVFKPSEHKIGMNFVNMLANIYGNKYTRDTQTLLRNITFRMKKGDRIGVIGLNGAGKTTLLRVLSGVYRPSSGTLKINGNSQSLIDVNLGMNVAATGIENIYLRGLQMGLKFNKIKEILPDVLEFAGIGDAVDNIYSSYSTGMKLRLAIAISTMIAPEILIMDEWISAGDEEFSRRLNKRMKTIIADSNGLIIATHNTGLMKSLCTKGLVLHKGKRVFYGKINEALDYYHEHILNTAEPA